MNNYELAAILDPRLTEDGVEKIKRELSELLTKQGVTIIETRTERRSFSYQIRKNREGTYLFINFQAPGSVPEKIRQDLLHREEIIRLAFFRLPPQKQKQTAETISPPEVKDE